MTQPRALVIGVIGPDDANAAELLLEIRRRATETALRNLSRCSG